MARPNRVPGILANLEYGLFLRFMVNPMELSQDKQTEYSTEPVSGWKAPIIRWVAGGEYTITFQLWFDRNEGSKHAGLWSMEVPFVKAMGPLSILRAFLYPQMPLQFGSLAGFFDSAFSLDEEYRPPPVAYLVYGARWLKCVVRSAPVTEQGHEVGTLVPNRFTADVTITVIEEGALWDAYANVEKGLAIGSSALGLGDTVGDLIGLLG